MRETTLEYFIFSFVEKYSYMVNSESEFCKQENWNKIDLSTESKEKNGDITDVADAGDKKSPTSLKVDDVVETTLDKGGGSDGQICQPPDQENEVEVEYADDGSSYYFYYYQPEDPFCYQDPSASAPNLPYNNMVAYPYSYEAAACAGEGDGTATEEQHAEEAVDIGLVPPETAADVTTGLLQPLPRPHNDLFINPAFSYLQFLSDGSVVGPMGEIYTPANYFPAHAAATAPVVDVSPPPPGSPTDMPGLLATTEYAGGKRRGLTFCHFELNYTI